MTNDFEDIDLKELIPNEVLTIEQKEFNNLSKDTKLDRLNTLIQRSQIYSQIIADNILENTLSKKRKREEDNAETEKSKPQAKKGRGRKKDKEKTKVKQDITAMLSKSASESTKSTKQAIENAQISHTQKQPKLITGCTMKDYQLDGLEWLITLYENGLNGILADEMGLGKTLQCIAFLSFLIENNMNGPFLVVVPLSTLSNWFDEIKKFAPRIQVLKYTGTKMQRQEIKLSEKYQIVLTSYEISIRDFNKLNLINWRFLIVDEGHRLKNSNCLLIKFLKKLNVTNRLLITGTPLQNNLDELWSLLNFILPDIFHDLELFQQWFNFDELMNFENDEEEDKETKRVIQLNIQENLIKNLHTILKPFLLRRLKKDVIKNLPPKKEYLIHISLTELQQKLYNAAMNNNLSHTIVEVYLKEFVNLNHSRLFKSAKDEKLINDFLQKKYSKQSLGTRKKDQDFREADSDEEFEISPPEVKHGNSVIFDSLSKPDQKLYILNESYDRISNEVKRMSLQNLVVQLRNICNSPYIFYDPFPKDENEIHIKQFMDILYKNTAKLQVLNQLCENLLENHKILIFSQFTRMLDLLHDWFIFKDIEICRLDGSTSHEDRDLFIKEFNNDPKKRIFLLSTRAGGLGINLTASDTVVLFDNDWNPQIDLQAIDRVHRIGQMKPVKIYRFLIRNSIEEMLISKSSSKRFLEKLVIQMGEFKFNKLQRLIENKNSNIKDFLEFSRTYKSNTNTSDDTINDDLSTVSDNVNAELLTSDEIQELTDRSRDCYTEDTQTAFKNITIFESVNNLDK